MIQFIDMPTRRELIDIGCKTGQEIVWQVVESEGKTEIRVYDAKTERLIGVIDR